MICGSLLVLHASKQNIYLEMSSVHLTLHRSTHEAITGAYPIRVLICHTHQDAAHTCLSTYSINYYPSCPLFLARLHIGMMFPRRFLKLFVYVYRDICFTCRFTFTKVAQDSFYILQFLQTSKVHGLRNHARSHLT